MKSNFATISIKTPEGIAFDLLLAGIVPRFLGWLVDVAAVMMLASISGKLLSLLAILPSLQLFVTPILYFIVWIGYGIFFEWIWRGQTPGKRLFNMRVMDVEGLRLQFSQVVIRNILRAVDALPGLYLLGGITCCLNSKCQRLGDIAANTIVVRLPKLAPPEFEALLGNKYNSLRAYPHLEARLRQEVTPAEAALALEALRRAQVLEPEESLQLFNDLASHFKERVEFPAEATDFVSSEQYVRNVVDVIYSTMRA
jgi:uncharacterized RDD family membrane protein YckC